MTQQPKRLRQWQEVISPKLCEAEFWNEVKSFNFSDRNPLNTEMFFLWCLIKQHPLECLFESGTYQGYSAEFLARAVRDLDTDFTTIGLSLENSYEIAKERLAPYKNVTVIDANSIEWTAQSEENTKVSAWWIDGPKGSNLAPLFEAIGSKFKNLQWIAVHDAEPEDWSRNRKSTLDYFADDVEITFCDESFQKLFSYMDEPLIGKSSIAPWYPHKLRGLENTSYGTQTVFVWTEGKPWQELKRK